MKSPKDRIVRPTLRCLLNDLGSEVRPASLRAALVSAERDMAADSHYLFPVPLVSAEHMTLDKANMLARDSAAQMEPIALISDRVMFKVKVADRRAALWRDNQGVWWLVAAGRRKDDGSGDFYEELARHAGNSDRLAPTDQDRRYLQFEEAYIADCEADREAQAAVIQTLLNAVAESGKAFSIAVFGALVTISIDSEDDDSEMLSMSFDFTSFKERDRFPIDIIGYVPGYDSVDDWDVLPPLRAGDPQCWYTYVSQDWVEWLATAVELDELLGPPWSPPTPSTSSAGQQSHRAPASVVMLGYIEGVEITALCGVRFTPYRNPDHFEECPACAQALALLRIGGRER